MPLTVLFIVLVGELNLTMNPWWLW